jgi:hypothetical protein
MSDAKGILGDVLGLLPVPGDHGHPDEMVTFQIEELFEGSRVGHRRGASFHAAAPSDTSPSRRTNRSVGRNV